MVRKTTARVVIESSSGFVESGAYAAPTTRNVHVQLLDGDGNPSNPGVPTVSRFFVDRPDAVQLHWRNNVEDLYNDVIESGEGGMNRFTTIHENAQDVVCRIGCLVVDEFGFKLVAEPAIVTVLAPYAGE